MHKPLLPGLMGAADYAHARWVWYAASMGCFVYVECVVAFKFLDITFSPVVKGGGRRVVPPVIVSP